MHMDHCFLQVSPSMVLTPAGNLHQSEDLLVCSDHIQQMNQLQFASVTTVQHCLELVFPSDSSGVFFLLKQFGNLTLHSLDKGSTVKPVTNCEFSQSSLVNVFTTILDDIPDMFIRSNIPSATNIP